MPDAVAHATPPWNYGFQPGGVVTAGLRISDDREFSQPVYAYDLQRLDGVSGQQEAVQAAQVLLQQHELPEGVDGAIKGAAVLQDGDQWWTGALVGSSRFTGIWTAPDWASQDQWLWQNQSGTAETFTVER